MPGLPSRLWETARRLFLLSSVILLPFVFWTPFNDCFPLPKMLALALFGGLALAAGPWRIPPVLAWVLPWGAWTAGMALLGSGVTTWWRSLPDALVLVLPALLAVSSSGSGPVFIRKLVPGFVAAASVIGGYALVQSTGMDLGGWISPFHKGVASTIGNPDLLGGMLVFPFALALAGWLDRRSVWRTLSVALIGGALVVTEARAAWLASLAVMLALLGRTNRKALGWVAAAGLLSVLAWLWSHPAALGMATSRSALMERWWTWKVSAHSIRLHPVAGWGTGSFRTVFLREQADLLKGGGTFHYTEFAHFEPLHLWTETGAVGLGLFLWGLASVFRGWSRGRHRPGLSGEWRGAGAGWAGLAADGLLSFPLHVPPTAAPAWTVAGVLMEGGKPPRIYPARLRAAVLLVLGAGLVPLFLFAPASGYLRLGQAQAREGRFLEAEALYAKSSALVPGDIRPWWYSAISARLAYSPSRALEMAGRGLQLEPAWAELHLERGMALKALGRLPEAELAYRESIRFNPGFSHAWNNLGNLLGAQGRLAEAEQAQRRALELAPDSPESRRNLAVTLARMGRKGEAQAVMGGLPGR
jgi:hypothetical protein